MTVIVDVINISELDFGAGLVGGTFKLSNGDSIISHASDILTQAQTGKVKVVKSLRGIKYLPIIELAPDGTSYQALQFERVAGITDGFVHDKKYQDNSLRTLIFNKYDETTGLYHFDILDSGWRVLKFTDDEIYDLQLTGGY